VGAEALELSWILPFEFVFVASLELPECMEELLLGSGTGEAGGTGCAIHFATLAQQIGSGGGGCGGGDGELHFITLLQQYRGGGEGAYTCVDVLLALLEMLLEVPTALVALTLDTLLLLL